MPENSTVADDLASQYAGQVTGDLERNLTEQERVGAGIAALQERLAALRRDHSVLVSVQRALGVPSPPAEPASSSVPPAAVPAPRTKAGPGRAKSGTRTRRTTAAPPVPAVPGPKPRADSEGRKAVAGKGPANATDKVPAKAPVTAPTAPRTAAPTLVELVRAHLTGQDEPRSAAEVCAALGRVRTGRSFRTAVVRNTLENLVAKGQARRSKRGGSVFYSGPGTAERAGAASTAAGGRPEKSG